jgi:hypothetical protein
VGDIPCPITKPIEDIDEVRIHEKSTQHDEPKGKRARLMSRAR